LLALLGAAVILLVLTLFALALRVLLILLPLLVLLILRVLRLIGVVRHFFGSSSLCPQRFFGALGKDFPLQARTQRCRVEGVPIDFIEFFGIPIPEPQAVRERE